MVELGRDFEALIRRCLSESSNQVDEAAVCHGQHHDVKCCQEKEGQNGNTLMTKMENINAPGEYFSNYA